MSKQVDFYLIGNQVTDGKYKLASRLANKLLKLKKKTLIVTDNPDATALLDHWLWSFSGTSFAAHDKSNEDGPSLIHINEASALDNQDLHDKYAVMINLCDTVPIISHHFERIAEIVGADDPAKTAGRARYKSYRNEGFALKTHEIEL